jgi:hypothetical protein
MTEWHVVDHNFRIMIFGNLRICKTRDHRYPINQHQLMINSEGEVIGE